MLDEDLALKIGDKDLIAVTDEHSGSLAVCRELRGIYCDAARIDPEFRVSDGDNDIAGAGRNRAEKVVGANLSPIDTVIA